MPGRDPFPPGDQALVRRINLSLVRQLLRTWGTASGAARERRGQWPGIGSASPLNAINPERVA